MRINFAENVKLFQKDEDASNGIHNVYIHDVHRDRPRIIRKLELIVKKGGGHYEYIHYTPYVLRLKTVNNNKKKL